MPNTNINKELEVAVYEKDLKKVRTLLSAGANPNIIAEREQGRGTLLHATSNVEITKELLLHGAEVDATNTYRETPLHPNYGLERSEKRLKSG